MKYEIWIEGQEHKEVWIEGQEYVEAWALVNNEKTLIWKKITSPYGNYFVFQKYIVYVNKDLTDYTILNLDSVLGWRGYPQVLELFNNDTWIVTYYDSPNKYYITKDFKNFELINSDGVTSISRLSDFWLHSYYCQNSNDYLRYYSDGEGTFVHYDAETKSISDEISSQPFWRLGSTCSLGGLDILPQSSIRLDINVYYREEKYHYTNEKGDDIIGTLRIPITEFVWTIFNKNSTQSPIVHTMEFTTPNKSSAQTNGLGIGISYWEENGTIYAMYLIGLTSYKIVNVGDYGQKSIESTGGSHHFRIAANGSNVCDIILADMLSGYYAEEYNPEKPTSFKRLANPNNVLGDVLITGYDGKHFWIVRNGSVTRYNAAMSNYFIKYRYLNDEEIHEMALNDLYSYISVNWEVIYIENGKRSKNHPRLYIYGDIMIFENGIDFDTVNKMIKLS